MADLTTPRAGLSPSLVPPEHQEPDASVSTATNQAKNEEGDLNRLPRRTPFTPVLGTGSYFSSAGGEVKKGFLDDNRLTLSGGYFGVEQRGDAYAALEGIPVSIQGKHFVFRLKLKGGLDVDVPYAKGATSIAGTFSAASLVGAKYDTQRFSLLAGAMVSAGLWVGHHRPFNALPDILLGASMLVRLRAGTLALGALASFPVAMDNMHNRTSVYPVPEKLSPVLSFQSRKEYVPSFRLIMDIFYRDGIEAKIEATEKFRFRWGNYYAEFDIGGYATMPISGDEPYTPMASIGVFFRGTFGIPAARFLADLWGAFSGNPQSTVAIDAYRNNPEAYGTTLAADLMSSYYATARAFATLKGYDAQRTGASQFHVGALTFSQCQARSTESWICSYPRSSDSGMASPSDLGTYQVEITRREDGTYTVSDVMTSYDVSAYRPLSTLVESKTYSEFIRSAKGLSFKDKIAAINLLARSGYRGNYDKMGIYFLNGDGKVNTASTEEMYDAGRNALRFGEGVPVTVCTGFAAFFAKVASDLGLKARTISIEAGELHAVAMVRAPGSSEYHFINYGSNDFSASGTMMDAIDAFIFANNYGPQVTYGIYDEHGRFLRRVRTTYGEQFIQRLLIDGEWELLDYLTGDERDAFLSEEEEKS